MKNGKVYSLIYLISLLFMIGFVGGCSDILVETKPIENQNGSLGKDTGLRIPDTFVHGVVSKDYWWNWVENAKVELWKDGNLLKSTFTNSQGAYSICVCCLGAGSGTYIVKAQKLYKPDGIYTDTDSFYWDLQNGGPWDFEIDLQLTMMVEKGDN